MPLTSATLTLYLFPEGDTASWVGEAAREGDGVEGVERVGEVDGV